MRVAIMQPYFMPYIGYFQLAKHVDKFVIYDDVQYTKKGWINRNYLNSDSGRWLFSLPLTSGSVDSLIRDKKVAPEFKPKSLEERVRLSYKSFEYLPESLRLLEQILYFSERNLFSFLLNSIRLNFESLEIPEERLVVSSSLGDFRSLKSESKVIEICKTLQATEYLNPAAGVHQYSANHFKAQGIDLLQFQPNIDLAESEKVFSILHNYIVDGFEKSRVKSCEGAVAKVI